jgi:putative hydrolase of the HAD superfamily
VVRAVLFDLDDTLVVEEPVAAETFAATARVAAERHELDAAALATGARARARELWWAGASHPYCQRIGISSWEGLWCRFEGGAPELAGLRAWAPDYRREAWRLALAEQGVEDPSLAEELGERFGVERRARHRTHADARAALDALSHEHRLAIVTNGASCLQREKLAASGLAECFHAVVVSGDLGTAKPDVAVFAHALDALGARADEAVMVGDTLERDVEGALAAGLRAVWVNRGANPEPVAPPDGVVEVRDLTDLARALEALG